MVSELVPNLSAMTYMKSLHVMFTSHNQLTWTRIMGVTKSDVNTPAFGPNNLIPPQGHWKQTGSCLQERRVGQLFKAQPCYQVSPKLIAANAATKRRAAILTA